MFHPKCKFRGNGCSGPHQLATRDSRNRGCFREEFLSPFTYTATIDARSSRSDLTRSAALGHAVGINSDRRRSVIHCHWGPKRVYDRTDEEEGYPPSPSTERLYGVILLRSLSPARSCPIDRNFRQWLTKEERGSRRTATYTRARTRVHTHATCYVREEKTEGGNAGAD